VEPKADAKPAPVANVDPKKDPEPSAPALKKGDTKAAKRIVEEADASFFEEDYIDAIKGYRKAIKADPTFTQAYRQLYKAGIAGADKTAIRDGGKGILQLEPDASDAASIKKNLARF